MKKLLLLIVLAISLVSCTADDNSSSNTNHTVKVICSYHALGEASINNISFLSNDPSFTGIATTVGKSGDVIKAQSYSLTHGYWPVQIYIDDVLVVSEANDIVYTIQ